MASTTPFMTTAIATLVNHLKGVLGYDWPVYRGLAIATFGLPADLQGSNGNSLSKPIEDVLRFSGADAMIIHHFLARITENCYEDIGRCDLMDVKDYSTDLSCQKRTVPLLQELGIPVNLLEMVQDVDRIGYGNVLMNLLMEDQKRQHEGFDAEYREAERQIKEEEDLSQALENMDLDKMEVD